MKRSDPRGLRALLLLPLCVAAHAASVPGDARVRELLAMHPAVAAAAQQLAAERAAAPGLAAAGTEWNLSSALTRRRGTEGGSTGEWEFGLERPWRGDAKRLAGTRLGEARVRWVEASRRLVWREQSRRLLERWVGWQRERLSARLWTAQAELLKRQTQAVAMRQRLGDAARVETLQAESALSQALAQAGAASARAEAAQAVLLTQYAGIELSSDDEAISPMAGDMPLDASVAAWQEHSPELAVAEAELAIAVAQRDLDATERRADPSIGVRIGGTPRTGERLIGLSFSMPLGGVQRTAQADAAESRRAASESAWRERGDQVRAEALRLGIEAAAARQAWRVQDDAARQLGEVAARLRRGWELGEGQLSDVIAAQRLAIEQQLGAGLAALEARQLQWRVDIETSRRWAPDW